MSGGEAPRPGEPSLAWLTGPQPGSRPQGGLSRGRLLLTGIALLLGIFLTVVIVWKTSQPSSSLRSARQGRITTSAVPPPSLDAPFAPGALRPLTPGEAVEWNATVPQSGVFNPPASPFVEPITNLPDYRAALGCLTTAIYYEAGSEPGDGQRAVAQVVLNRVRHVIYPHSVCGVVFEGAERTTGCQFTFVCDGAMTRPPEPRSWARAGQVAAAALAGSVYAPVGLATNYHAAYVVPYWAATLDKVATIGAHIFYRIQGALGERTAFRAFYIGGERAAMPASALLLLPDAATADTVGTAADQSTTDVTVTDRPVLIQEPSKDAAALASAKVATVPVDRPAVTMRERWIVPHGDAAPARAEAEEAAATNQRSVIMPSDEPKP